MLNNFVVVLDLCVTFLNSICNCIFQIFCHALCMHHVNDSENLAQCDSAVGQVRTNPDTRTTPHQHLWITEEATTLKRRNPWRSVKGHPITSPKTHMKQARDCVSQQTFPTLISKTEKVLPKHKPWQVRAPEMSQRQLSHLPPLTKSLLRGWSTWTHWMMTSLPPLPCFPADLKDSLPFPPVTQSDLGSSKKTPTPCSCCELRGTQIPSSWKECSNVVVSSSPLLSTALAVSQVLLLEPLPWWDQSTF